METFYALYEKLARGALAGGHEAALREVEKLDFDPHQLDCLLNPKRYAPIWRLAPCDCGEGNPPARALARFMPSAEMKMAILKSTSRPAQGAACA